MFKTIHNSVNISPTENTENTEKLMFGCGSKYFSERLKLEHVYKYALRMVNGFYTSPTQNV